jgi:hypothetical protein
MAETKIKAAQFHGVVGHGTDGYFLMTNADGSMSWASNIANPTITSIAYPDSATAADPDGGETITVTGTGFKTGATVTVGGTAASPVSYVSGAQITFSTPAKTAGDYDIVITNTDTGSATYINGISYNGIPSWTTAAGSLGTFASGETISTITLQATEPDAGTITFNITSGALPTGLSLTGADIDGTTSLETAETLYTFTVTATDDESQSTPRTFTITVQKQFTNTDHFDIVTYTGSNQETSRSISSLNFQPDLIISKVRNDNWPFFTYDSVRGAGTEKEITTTSTDAEGDYNNQAYGYLSSFDSNGFTSSVGPQSPYDNQYFNKSGATFVTWCWKAGGAAVSNTDGSITSQVSANTNAGFSISTYTGTGSATSFGHGLDSPDLVIVKSTTDTRNWIAHFTTLGNGSYILLNEISAEANSSARISSVGTSVVNIGTSSNVNANGQTYVCYSFKSIDGYQKIGSFNGDGNTSQDITTGFQPRFVILRLTSGSHWFLFDSERGTGEGTSEAFLLNANTTALTNRDGVNFTSTGFTIYDGDNFNASGAVTVYLAIA